LLALKHLAAQAFLHENKKRISSSARLVSADLGNHPRISAVYVSLRWSEHVSGTAKRSTAGSAAEESRLPREVISIANPHSDRLLHLIPNLHDDDTDDTYRTRLGVGHAVGESEELFGRQLSAVIEWHVRHR